MKKQHPMKSLPQQMASLRSIDGQTEKFGKKAELKKELQFWEDNLDNILLHRKTSGEIPSSKIVATLLANLYNNRDYYTIILRMKTLRKQMEFSSSIIDLYTSLLETPFSMIGCFVSIISFLCSL